MFSLTRNFTVIAFTGWIYCIENFFTFPWKTEFALNIFAVLSILLHSGLSRNLRFCPEFTAFYIHFLTFRIFEQLAPALYWNIFYHSGFLSNLCLPWKTECALNFFTVVNIYFFHSEFLSNLRLPWKTERAQNFFTVSNIYFLPFKNFEQLALALKNRDSLEIFHCIEIFFTIQDFWATCACPENRVCPEHFLDCGAADPTGPPPRTPMYTSLLRSQDSLTNTPLQSMRDRWRQGGQMAGILPARQGFYCQYRRGRYFENK